MIEHFQTADFVIAGMTLAMAVMGLFRGFSGTLGFVLALPSALAVAGFGWPFSAMWIDVQWMRGAVVLVAALLTFGLVRMVVKKLVNGLLAQPSDALLGMVVGAAFGGLLLVAWARSGFYTEFSYLATEVAAYVR